MYVNLLSLGRSSRSDQPEQQLEENFINKLGIAYHSKYGPKLFVSFEIKQENLLLGLILTKFRNQASFTAKEVKKYIPKLVELYPKAFTGGTPDQSMSRILTEVLVKQKHVVSAEKLNNRKNVYRVEDWDNLERMVIGTIPEGFLD